MTPIVSPWVFYAMDVISEINLIVGALFFVLLTATIALCVIIACMYTDGCDDDCEYARLKRIFKKVVIAFAIATTVTTVLPSEKTIVQMIVAKNVTYERFEATADVVENVYNDILDLFDKEEKTNG